MNLTNQMELFDTNIDSFDSQNQHQQYFYLSIARIQWPFSLLSQIRNRTYQIVRTKLNFFVRTLKSSLIYDVFSNLIPCLSILFLVNKFDSIDLEFI